MHVCFPVHPEAYRCKIYWVHTTRTIKVKYCRPIVVMATIVVMARLCRIHLETKQRVQGGHVPVPLQHVTRSGSSHWAIGCRRLGHVINSWVLSGQCFLKKIKNILTEIVDAFIYCTTNLGIEESAKYQTIVIHSLKLIEPGP